MSICKSIGKLQTTTSCVGSPTPRLLHSTDEAIACNTTRAASTSLNTRIACTSARPGRGRGRRFRFSGDGGR
eukprot:scaffold23797_cov118-Isochrysis_galbana.AAC.1